MIYLLFCFHAKTAQFYLLYSYILLSVEKVPTPSSFKIFLGYFYAFFPPYNLYNLLIKFHKVYFGDLDWHFLKFIDLFVKMGLFQYPKIYCKKNKVD